MSPRPSLSILLVFFLTSLQAASADGGTNNAIQETCKKCPQEDPTNVSYKFCVASLKLNTNSCRADLRGLGLISVELQWHNVTDTMSYTEKLLLKSEKMDPFIKASLQDCLELYSNAVLTVNEAIRAYKDEKYEDANIDLSSVMDASTTYEDGFTEKGATLPLAERTEDGFRLSAFALSIVSILLHSSH